MILDDQLAAVVTGGASGLGEATVRVPASLGAKIAIFEIGKHVRLDGAIKMGPR